MITTKNKFTPSVNINRDNTVLITTSGANELSRKLKKLGNGKHRSNVVYQYTPIYS